jgi:hypothetical protein
MLNPKYDPNNYVKLPAVIITSQSRKLDQLFGSPLLLVKWKLIGNFKTTNQTNLNGVIRVSVETPLGSLEPDDYSLRISRPQKQFIQFLRIPRPDFPYSLEIFNASGIEKSSLEIWEYIEPQSFLNSMPTYDNSEALDLSGLIAATADNASAINALASAMGDQPEEIADAIANNAVQVINQPSVTVGTNLIQLFTANNNRQSCTVKNNGSNRIRLWIGGTLPNTVTGYNSAGSLVTLNSGGSYEFVNPDQKSNCWAVAQGANGDISVTSSLTT